MPLPQGAYIVFGQRLPFDAAPQVHLLDARQQVTFMTARQMAADSSNPELYTRQAFKQFFRMPDADTAIPAWSREALELIATGYEGPHKVAVRGLAAAIALGRTFSRDKAPKDSDDSGGTKVTANDPKPKSPAPSGRAFDKLLQDAPV
jgi:hypothetical protein